MFIITQNKPTTTKGVKNDNCRHRNSFFVFLLGVFKTAGLEKTGLSQFGFLLASRWKL